MKTKTTEVTIFPARCIALLTHGWVFVGTISKTGDGYHLADAQNIRSWSGDGYGGLVNGTAKKSMDSEVIQLNIPKKSMVFFSEISW